MQSLPFNADTVHAPVLGHMLAGSVRARRGGPESRLCRQLVCRRSLASSLPTQNSARLEALPAATSRTERMRLPLGKTEAASCRKRNTAFRYGSFRTSCVSPAMQAAQTPSPKKRREASHLGKYGRIAQPICSSHRTCERASSCSRCLQHTVPDLM